MKGKLVQIVKPAFAGSTINKFNECYRFRLPPPQMPNTLNNHIITTIITTMFKIDLMDDAIGM